MDVTSLYNAEFMDHVAHPDYKYQMENPTCTHEGVNQSLKHNSEPTRHRS